MNDSDSFEETDTYTTMVHQSYLEIVALDGWIALTGVLNIFVNSLTIYGFVKSRLFGVLNIFVLNMAVIDIINQIFCPTIFRLTAWTDDIFKDFTNHRTFICMYFTSMYMFAFLIFILMLRNYAKFIDRIYIYVIAGMWIMGIATFTISYLNYTDLYSTYTFIPPYVIILAVLITFVHVHQIRSTLRLCEHSGKDYQISLLLVLTYTASRIIGAMFVLLGELLSGLVPLNIDYFILGFIQLQSLAYFFIFYHFEEEFRHRMINMVKKSVTPRPARGFLNLEEEHTLPE